MRDRTGVRVWRSGSSHRLEVKYVLISLVILGIVGVLIVTDALSGLSGVVDDLVLEALGWGFVGMFLVALVANLSLAIQIPYTLPILAAAIQGRSFAYVLGLGLAAGLGSALGGLASMLIAQRLFTFAPSLSESRIYQWVERNARARPAATGGAAFVVAATPLPDDSVIVPLAMIGYGCRRIAAPYAAGKVLHNLAVAALFFEFSRWFAAGMDKTVRTDASIVLVVVFILLACYQAEKTLTSPKPDPLEQPT